MSDDIQQKELDDARKGILFFLGHLDVQKDPSFDLGLISNFVSNTSILSDLKNGSATLLNSFDTGKKIVEGVQHIKKKLTAMLQTFFDAITERIAKLYGESGAVLEWVGEFGVWAASAFAGSLSDIIPGWGYVQSASDLYDGIKKSVIKAIAWISQVFSGWGVRLLEGGPTMMARALAQHSATGLAGGLKDIAITSCKVGLQAAGDAAAGAGAVVGAVTGILQRIANMVEYCVQRYLLNRLIGQAKHQWDTQGEMLTNPMRFHDWFQKACVCTPVVAALVMMSGYAAHPYRFLELIADEGGVIDQDKFDQGVQHIDTLKDLSKDYLKEYQNVYKLIFTSHDPVSMNLLSKTR